MLGRPELERPVLVAAFRGWNDGGQGATLAAGYLARALECREVRGDRPGGLRRLPGEPAARLARRRADAQDRVARELVLLGARARRTGRHPAARRRAEPPLALLLPARDRSRARSRRPARRDPRLAARRRAAHARRTGDRRRERSTARRRPRPPALALRGPDRHRRRARRRVPARGDARGEPLGRGAALRLARAEPACRARPVRPPRRAPRHPDRHDGALRGGGDLRRAGHRGRLGRSRDGRVRRGARAAHRRPRSRGARGSAVRRLARGRADALPARARRRERRPTSRRATSSARSAPPLDRPGVADDAVRHDGQPLEQVRHRRMRGSGRCAPAGRARARRPAASST